MSKLVLRNVSRAFGDYVAVDNLNLTIEEGELVSLLGPSGCGKTTTLRMMAGFLSPTGGTIEVADKVVSSPGSSLPPEKRNMSMIFQSYAIWPNMTVAENVGFGLKIRKIESSEIARRVDEILDVVKLRHLRDRYPAELSGGQQQRVSLARSIVVKPAVLLLDEPLSNLDANLREEMRFEIRRLHDEFNITMVYVTHDQAEAMVTSDRIAVMNKGKIEQIDKPFELYCRPKTAFVAGFIGRTNFLEGRLDGGQVDFGGFGLPAAALGEGLSEQVKVSVRPQCIHLHRSAPPAGDGRYCVAAKIDQRAYLGESWDYQIRIPGLAEPLRVTARPQEVFDMHEDVIAEIDATQVTVIE
ncbi:ABC transporter ATP-binding protein [Burkholderiaceae bacterium FT117]|uniref:ABC transporter ATP-binding protein n=1 Tax=Zeimonas sediminis TaxID=2944268 RepID=UPI0023430893|nr:ABC transporter ATP-binding protein [Zeimonas sediminis]MCM5571772.1 ABC transporter ATP-binding protein [Zeimonas sediminis]